MKDSRAPCAGYRHDWQVLDTDPPLPYPEHQAVYIEPPVLQDKHIGLLPIILPALRIPLTPQPTSIGRYLGDDSPADIPLGWLHTASCLVYRHGEQKGNLETMGLSGEHLEVSIHGRGLQLRQMSKNLSHIIQSNGSIRQTLSINAPLGEMRHGECVVIGNYRFELLETFLPEQKA